MLFGILALANYLGAFSSPVKHKVKAAPQKTGNNDPALAKPYASVAEARRMLQKAHMLYSTGEAKGATERNRAYKQAHNICQRVLATKGIPEKLESDAGFLNYTTYKLQSAH